MTQKHFLVVGAGVAGISICKQLITRGHRVTLIDSGINRSSVIAAGLINPIVFRRMTKSWRVDEFLPYATKFYSELSEECKEQFLFPIDIRRLFSSVQERNFWLEKQEKDGYKDYLHIVTDSDNTYSLAKNEFGTGRLKQGYYVSTISFLELSKKWIALSNQVICEKVDYADVDPETVSFKGTRYDGIVFCEGVEARHNPWFENLPINDTKGETISIRSTTIPEGESLNRKCFTLPIGNHEFRVGATYDWNTYNDDITEEGKKQLQEMLAYITDQPYTIIDQKAGIRPTTIDRRPLMGTHHIYKNLFVFNGLGTKGYLLAPLLSKELVDHILDDSPLYKEVLVSRTLK